MEPVVEEGLSGEIFVSRLIRSCRTYQEDSSHWNEKIIDCARSVLKDVEVLGVADDIMEVGVDMHCVGIELVPPKYITGYMTEKGFLVPGDISEGERRGTDVW